MRIILFFIFIFFVPIVSAAYYGGDVLLLNITDCADKVVLDVRASMDVVNGEYSFGNCSRLHDDSWFCSCITTFSTLPNTMNKYIITTSYIASSPPKVVSGGGSVVVGVGDNSSSTGSVIVSPIIVSPDPVVVPTIIVPVNVSPINVSEDISIMPIVKHSIIPIIMLFSTLLLLFVYTDGRSGNYAKD